MPEPEYSGDSSMLINAWRKHYPPDIFPTVWERIDGLVQSTALIASDEVRVEIEKSEAHGAGRAAVIREGVK